AATTAFPTTGAEGVAFFLKILNAFLLGVTAILALSIPITLALAWRTRSVAYAFMGFALLVSTLPLLWFLPFTTGLFEWMYQATFGDGARNMEVTYLPVLANLWVLLDSSGSFLLLSGLAILLSSLLAGREFLAFL